MCSGSCRLKKQQPIWAYRLTQFIYDGQPKTYPYAKVEPLILPMNSPWRFDVK